MFQANRSLTSDFYFVRLTLQKIHKTLYLLFFVLSSLRSFQTQGGRSIHDTCGSCTLEACDSQKELSRSEETVL